MKKYLTTTNNNNFIDNKTDETYLYFKLGLNRYAIKIQQVIEIIKLPKLEYPQKLHNNIIGLLNYNNFTINIIDLRFYLNINVDKYDISNHLLIVKTDEMIFGLIIDNAEDIVFLDKTVSNNLSFPENNNIIEKICQKESVMISIVNLNAIEEIIKTNTTDNNNFDVQTLFPQDDDSIKILQKRKDEIQRKNEFGLSSNIFSQDKYITFSLNSNIYCINIDYTKEFIKNIAITKIPCNLSYIEGIINLRGEFYTIVNLSEFINENIISEKEKNNVIIIDFADYKIGIIVNEIFKIESIAQDVIIPKKESSNYILGEAIINNNVLNVLDIKNILADEKFFIEQI